MGVPSWAVDRVKNAVADPTIAASDGASARQFMDSLRGVMAGVAAYTADQGGALVSTGNANTYVVTSQSGVVELRPGVRIGFWADRDNTDAPFLNVDGTGPKPLFAADGAPLLGGGIQLGVYYEAIWSGAVSDIVPQWRLAGSTGGASGSVVKADATGPLSGRAAYDQHAVPFVYLAVSGSSWTLYAKQSDAAGDWSAGLPIKASPAQSVAGAQEAADTATAQAQLAITQATAATAQAVLGTTARQGAEGARDAAAGRATAATASAAEAAQYAALVGQALYDMGTLDQPSDGSTTFDMGTL